MNLTITLSNTILFYVKKYWFENVIFILLLFYTLFYFTPSSYGKALEMLGIPNTGLIFGTPQAARSDEWAVWTPYLQALVNNHFQRFNAYSIYHEDFRNFNALPIYDWALFFKPQFWSFLIAEPARAFSFHHGFLIAAFIIGWKQLIEKIMLPYQYASPGIAIGFSLLLFFSGFVQTFWTTVGPIIAIFPWLLLVLLAWKQHSITYYALLIYVTTVWLLSHTYPPLVISCIYIGLFILGAFKTDFFSNFKRCFFSLFACLAAVAIVVYYDKDVIIKMMSTVYPGKRQSLGGEGNFYMWLSTIIPYITHSTSRTVTIVNSLNICEATAVSSLLPLMSLCFADFKSIKDLFRKEIVILSCALVFFTAWWLFPVPQLIGELLLLTKVPAHRLVFSLGLAINIKALFILVEYGVRLNFKRLLIFTFLLLFCWCLPAIFSHYNYFSKFDISDGAAPFEKSTLELIVIPLITTLLISYRFKWLNNTVTVPVIVFTAMLPNILYFSTFNPIQSAKSIFTAKNSEIVAALKKMQHEDSRDWLVFPVIPGAVLNGLGLRSFSHVLIQPQLDFFRTLFPEIPANEFNHIFNRYAHIELYDIPKPGSPYSDRISIPIKKIREKSSNQEINIGFSDCNIKVARNGYLEAVTLDNKKLYLSGWITNNDHRYLTNLKSSKLIAYHERPRLDIVGVQKDAPLKDLLVAGIGFEIMLSEDDIKTIRNEGFCLFNDNKQYGITELFHFSTADIEAFMRKK
ncbi:MAG: hypothetical protein HOP02_08290 [Methylococcaceae bacterium]|nr:hypothetical protein [Methylococcaceae bacterium]